MKCFNRIVILQIFLCLSNFTFAQNWSQVENFPGTARDDGYSFNVRNVVKTITSNGLQVELDVTHLEAGQYLVKVSTENKIQEVKRMILRK